MKNALVYIVFLLFVVPIVLSAETWIYTMPDNNTYQFDRTLDENGNAISLKTEGLNNSVCNIFDGYTFTECINTLNVSANVQGWFTISTTSDTMFIETNYTIIYVNGVKQ